MSDCNDETALAENPLAKRAALLYAALTVCFITLSHRRLIVAFSVSVRVLADVVGVV
jgi:hypothetical protein